MKKGNFREAMGKFSEVNWKRVWLMVLILLAILFFSVPLILHIFYQ